MKAAEIPRESEEVSPPSIGQKELFDLARICLAE